MANHKNRSNYFLYPLVFIAGTNNLYAFKIN